MTLWPTAGRKLLSFKDEENKQLLTRGEVENPGPKNCQKDKESIPTASTPEGRGPGGKEPEERGRKEMCLNDLVSPKFTPSYTQNPL